MLNHELAVSVIFPTYNRAGIVKQCLEALARQTLPAEAFEVIVSDDGSEDETKMIAETFACNGPLKVNYLWQPNRGASAARNRAIRAARGGILVIINDDTIATPTLLQEHLESHESYPGEACAVLGRVTVSPEVPPSIFTRLHLDASFNKLDGRRVLDWRAFYTCNLSVKRSFLLKHGLFEEKIRLLHEDLELGERLSHQGLQIIYNPRALGYHYHYLEEKEFLASAKRDGISLSIWHQKAPHLKKELASQGFYLTASPFKRLRCMIGDLLINRFTRPSLLLLARSLADKHEDLALMLYNKIYQTIKRTAIRDEVFKK